MEIPPSTTISVPAILIIINQPNRLLHVHQFEAQCGVTCDEVGLVGGEVEDEGGDLFCGADAPHLLTRYEVLQRRVGVRVGLKKAQ